MRSAERRETCFSEKERAALDMGAAAGYMRKSINKFNKGINTLLCSLLLAGAAAVCPAVPVQAEDTAVIAESAPEDAVPDIEPDAEVTDITSLDGLIEVTGEKAGTAGEVAESAADAKKDKEKERRLVVGFKSVGLLKSIEFEMGEKPSLESLQAQFPTQLDVYLLGESKPQTVSVTWTSVGDDYEGTNLNYYFFTPKFDDSRYRVKGLNLQLDEPYIEVIQRALTYEMIDSAPPKVNEAAVYKFLKNSLGLNTAAACGVLANIYCESGFRTNAIGDGGTSVGICQWHNSRWTNLKSYAPDDWQELKGQLRFMAWGLRMKYRDTRKYLRNVPDTAQGAYNAGYYWCLHYEMPDRMVSRGMTRGYLARNVYWPRYGLGAEGDEQSGDQPEKAEEKYDASYAGSYLCISDDGLLIRSEPSTESSVAGFIPFDELVTVSKADGEWAAVQYGDTQGYSSMEFLERTGETEQKSAEP